MERLVERRQDLKKALKNFHDSINVLNESKSAKVSPVQIMIIRDSVIKRFELTYDLLWKCVKDYLEHQIGILVVSPKKVFLEARAQNLLAVEELEEILAVVDDRNLSAHTYDDAFAEEIAQRAISHFQVMKKISERIES